jgi:hypothetical protein
LLLSLLVLRSVKASPLPGNNSFVFSQSIHDLILIIVKSFFKIEMDEQLTNKGFLTIPTVEKYKSSWPMNASPENMLDNKYE